MPARLSEPIAAYFAAANAHDSDGTAACFTDDAVVHDEGREMRGLVAIRAWKEETDQKYWPVTDVTSVAETGGQTIVTGRVSGQFPGSPIELRYVFTLNGQRIASLEIR